ncbi:hypothetical protein ACFQZI_16860 [Mucilaginibacter lutimaris]|uniref:Uncharacterized protein n=2 Tax=Mucilaginibacter lutimaris TaxID=931629 RepID=A0ABW2ZJV5_9SPHI
MKNVLGGGLPPDPTQPGPHPCINYVVCGGNDVTDTTSFYGICCNSLADAQTYCRAHGYTGVYGCVDNGIA